MPTKHIAGQIEAYLDHRLSPEERRAVEAHLAACPTCARRMADAWRVSSELGPTMQKTLGQPMLPPALRYRVRRAIDEAESPRQSTFPWALSGRLLNGVGTLVVIALLALGVFAVLQGRLPGNPVLNTQIDTAGGDRSATEAPNPASPSSAGQPAPVVRPALSSLGDTLPSSVLASNRSQDPPPANAKPNQDSLSPPEPVDESPSDRKEGDSPQPPQGLIAFSFFNPTPGHQAHEIHLINPDGTDHRLFPLDGVSEPALRRADQGYQLAYRAWGETTAPRSLLSSDLNGKLPNRVGGYWEDAQPDWSPKEYRLIFASQRESDRRWRLYTIWGDGLAEVDLRREGRSPSFGPDGHHFVFEGCDDTGNRCGLWRSSLDGDRSGSQLLLEDPLAKSPDWSPLDEKIAYMSNIDDNWDLYLFDQERGRLERLTIDPATDGLPAWSPNGKWLAFLSNRGGNWGIWLLHLASGDIRQIFDIGEGTFTPPNREPYDERHWWDEQISWSR